MNTVNTLESRIQIVNEIIKKIASLDRKFFAYEDRIAYIFNVNKKLYMRSEYNNFDINLSSKKESKPYEFTHGGTLWGLTKDFKEFILTGIKSNGENGYGGLYCPHWGYTEESMKEIQEFAKDKGYL